MYAILLAVMSIVATSVAAGAADCPPPRVDLGRLAEAMAKGRFVSYQPTSLKLIAEKLTQADEASIRADLMVLRPYFDGLITYGALNGAERVPDVAASLGFRAVIVGVWNPADETELANAVAAWKRHPELVVGLSLGNEIVFARRGGWPDLARFIKATRLRAPSLPLSTTEPFAEFLDQPGAKPVLADIDFLLANVHPVFQPWFRSAPPFNWADFVVRVSGRLEAIFCGPILVKETGVPTGPADLGFSEEKQRAFYRELEKQMLPTRTLAFSYFAAFDAPWLADAPNPVPGPHPEEAFWGLFTQARDAKIVVKHLPRLSPGAAR